LAAEYVAGGEFGTAVKSLTRDIFRSRLLFSGFLSWL